MTDEVRCRPRLLRTAPRKCIHLLIIAATALLVYSNTLHVPFVFDGKGQIRDNRMIKDLGNFNLALEGSQFSQPEGYLYVPTRLVGYLSFALNYYFDRLDVVQYHLTNLSVHFFNAMLVYFFVVLTFDTPAMRMWASPHGPPEAAASRTVGLLALFTSLLFVSHPIQTEAVTYIVQRFTSLATMFYMLSVVMYIKGRLLTEEARDYKSGATGMRIRGKNERPQTKSGHSPHSADNTSPLTYQQPAPSRLLPIVFFSFSFLAAALAMKTKEISFTLPAVIVMYEFVFFPSSLRRRLAYLAPALLTLTIIPLTLIGINQPISQVLSDVTEKTRLETSISRVDYLLTQIRVVTTYIRLFFFPAGQNIDYDYPIYHSLLAPPVLFSFIFLSAVFATGAYLLLRSRQAVDHEERSGEHKLTGEKESSRSCRQEATTPASLSSFTGSGPLPAAPLYRLIAFGIFWFFVTLSVTSSIIPIADVIVEHRTYLPSIGAFLGITASGFVLAGRLNLSDRKRAVTLVTVFGVIVVMLSAAAYSRNAVWGSATSLWQDAEAKSPKKARPHNNLGEAYYQQNRLDEAAREFQTALKLSPDYAVARNNYGTVCAARGFLAQAVGEFQTALALDPSYADAHYNLGQAYLLMGQTEQAAREFRSALRLNPADTSARRNLVLLVGNKMASMHYNLHPETTQARDGNGGR